jgi:hypothetical protein
MLVLLVGNYGSGVATNCIMFIDSFMKIIVLFVRYWTQIHRGS